MLGPKEACKYLINYPFSPLTAAKSHNLLQYATSLACWRTVKPEGSIFLFLLPFADILGLAIAVVSLWFMVQKFYWKKLEMGMNAIGSIMTFLTVVTLVLNFELDVVFLVTHIFTLGGWMFCLWWSWQKTSNTVSNLFIANWGEATTEIEIEALEEHF